ncbi:acetyltransferase domain-containing protein [Nemania serpens]|nr:acetyltransferase domain-containing protein [Nemania serpens]
MASITGADAPSVTVRTTLPREPLPAHPVTKTARLLLRALTQDDLAALHELRTNAGFMSETSLGKPDSTMAETQASLTELIITPSSSSSSSRPHFVFGVFVAETDELIGDAGIHTIRGGSGGGWPEIGYKLHPARWGRGYVTEAMRGILKAWWELPREEAVVEVHPCSVSSLLLSSTLPRTEGYGQEEEEEEKTKDKEERRKEVRERVVAEIASYNIGSRRVLEKLGFEHFGSWEEPDTQLHRLGQPLMLGHYVLARPA